jgi:hypothetical protein
MKLKYIQKALERKIINHLVQHNASNVNYL